MKKTIFLGGPPSKTASDGGNGEILIYSSQKYDPGLPNIGLQPQTYWDNKYFYINSEGKIYHWMTRRELVPPAQIDLTIYRRY